MKFSLLPPSSLLQVLDYNDGEHLLSDPMTKEKFIEDYLGGDKDHQFSNDGDFFYDVFMIHKGVMVQIIN